MKLLRTILVFPFDVVIYLLLAVLWFIAFVALQVGGRKP